MSTSTRKRAVRVAGLVTVLMTIAAPAAAATADQAQEEVQSFARVNSDGFVQTFTAGVDDNLSHVSLALQQNDDPDAGDLVVELRAVDAAGAPTATVLANASVPSTSIPDAVGWVDVPFDLAMTAGTQYAIFLTVPATDPECGTAGCGYMWGIAYQVGYTGGEFFLGPAEGPWSPLTGYDAAFQTWVGGADEPATIASLTEDVQALGLNSGQEGGLLMWLERAQADLDAGDLAGACSDLAKFSRKVQTWSGKHIDSESAAALLADAAEVSANLGC